MNGFVGVVNREKWNSQCEHEQPMKQTMEQTNGLFCTCDSVGCGSLSLKQPVSLLANEFDVRSVLQGQVSLAAVNQIYVIHEVKNGCKTLKIH